MNDNKLTIVIVAVAIIAIAGFVLLKSVPQVNQSQADVDSSTDTIVSVSPNPTSTQTPSDSVSQSETMISASANGFMPKEVVIKANTTVTWTNLNGIDITVNSDPHPAHTLYPFLNVGTIKAGERASLLFDQPGKYTYHNHLNSSQTGTITVE